jgi:energy-coupling factor transporter ATP-binding protein EcfA2
VSSAPSRSRPDELTLALDAAVETISAAIPRLAVGNPVVLIDGRSGSGKSTLAQRLVASWPQRGPVQLVALDSLYPGWDGLQDGAAYARERILVPHARGRIGVWQRWDWAADERAEAHAVDPSLALVVEGSGILTAGTEPLGDLRVWVDAPAAARKDRALARDGETFRPHWDRWAAQEDAHIARDEPFARATHAFAFP